MASTGDPRRERAPADTTRRMTATEIDRALDEEDTPVTQRSPVVIEDAPPSERVFWWTFAVVFSGIAALVCAVLAR